MKLQTKLYTSLALLACLFVAACKKDNLEPPTATVTGKIVYQGTKIFVRTPTVSNGTPSSGVQLELWQHGYQLFTKIPVYVNWDGTFSAAVFDGDYKLVMLKGTGPWVDKTDSIDVHVSGNTAVDFQVEPYYFIKSATAAKSGTNVTATVSLQRVNTSKTLEAVRIYVHSGTVLDQSINTGNTSVAASAITDATQPITLSTAIPAALSAKDYVYVRVGVKTTGITELAYSEPIKVMLK